MFTISRSVVVSGVRPFSSSSRHNNNNNQSKQRSNNDNDTRHASEKKAVRKGGDAGRIVVLQTTGKFKEGGTPKLCSGCGTEVRRGSGSSSSQMLSGADAVLDGTSKKRSKLGRYVDAVDSRQGGNSAFLCERCKALKSNNVWKAYDALTDVSPEVFSSQLKHIVSRRRFGLCIMVVDSTDAEHSAMKGLRNCIGKTPCWLVLNKIDLVPRMNHHDVNLLGGRIKSVAGTIFLETFPVSAATGKGVLELAEALLEKLRGRDVFVVGAANVGKSSLVQKLAGMIADAVYMKGFSKKRNQRRDINNNLAVTESHLPGTTLQAVRIPCFSSDRHALWDTPGIINKKAVNYSLFPVHLMEPLARPERIPLPSKEDGTQGQWRPGFSILIEAAWMTEEEGMDDNYDPNDNDQMKVAKQPNNAIESCVLGRIDLKSIEEGDFVYTQAYLHPSLRMRVVPTDEAPDHATVPDRYLKLIQERMRRASGRANGTTSSALQKDSYSIPLKPFVNPPIMPNGEIVPADKEYKEAYGCYYMDIVFASLGWIGLTHNSKFTVIPHCVEGSVFSKRRSLYPNNLAQTLEHVGGGYGGGYEYSVGGDDDDYDDDGIPHHEEESEETIRERLREASRRGRHQGAGEYHGGRGGSHGGRGGSGSGEYSDSVYAKGFDEDEWY